MRMAPSLKEVMKKVTEKNNASYVNVDLEYFVYAAHGSAISMQVS